MGDNMIDEQKLLLKLRNKAVESFSDEECEWITYYESLKSRSDKEHDSNRDPLVGALIRDKDGHILEISHRASGQEGDHAAYVLIINKLSGQDLTDCHLFTTLEPCVDDSRSAVGKSCSSIICKSEIKNVHIGILDPNPIVRERGISVLFKNGINILPYSGEVVEFIFNSCETFRNPTPTESELILRFKKDVLPFFDQNALDTYLKDYCLANNKNTDDFEKNRNDFILDLIRRQFVTFDARNIEVNDLIKILFYKKEYLPHSFARAITVIDKRNKGIDRGVITIDYPLPLLFHYIEDNYKNELIDHTAFREIVGNLLIHRSYDINSSLGYIEISEVDVHFINEASKNLNHSHLEQLPLYKAKSKAGNGIIAEFFNMANYCERSKKGQKTFKELKDKMSISVDENNNVDVHYKYFG